MTVIHQIVTPTQGPALPSILVCRARKWKEITRRSLVISAHNKIGPWCDSQNVSQLSSSDTSQLSFASASHSHTDSDQSTSVTDSSMDQPSSDEIMHQSFEPLPHPPPHLWGWAGDNSGSNVLGNDLLSSPAVPGLWYYVNIPHGIYSYKEQGYDSQQLPAVCTGLLAGLLWMKSHCSRRLGGGGSGYKWLVHYL